MLSLIQFTYGQTIDSNFVDGIIYFRVTNNCTTNFVDYDFQDPTVNVIYSNFQVDSVETPFTGLNDELDRTHRMYFSNWSLIDSLISEMNSLACVEYAEKAPLYKTVSTPNDYGSNQWYLDQINALGAWAYSLGSDQVKVAIVDNAVSTTHEDLTGVLYTNPNEIPSNGIDDDLNGFVDDVSGWDAADNDNNPNPPSWTNSSSPFVHGTHCAGIACATTDNQTGIASIGYGIQYIPVKCSKDLSTDEGASLPNAYDGVYYAIQAGADIISMSWGGSSGLFVTGESIINAGIALDIVMVAAAGNANTDQQFYPAAYNNVFGVGATNQLDERAYFSNYGSYIDVMAPGVDIYSTLSGANDAYGSLQGTSMACPLVTGLCGLVKSIELSYNRTAIESIVKNGCLNIDSINPNYEGDLGAGRIDALKSFQLALGIDPESFESLYTLFPNPNHGDFNLVYGGVNSQELTVRDIHGKTIHETVLLPHNAINHIDLELKKGIYFIDVEQYKMKFVVW